MEGGEGDFVAGMQIAEGGGNLCHAPLVQYGVISSRQSNMTRT